MKTQLKSPLHLEIAAALLVPAAAFGLIRAFANHSDVYLIMLAAFATSVLSIILRSLKVNAVISLLISLTALVMVVSHTMFSDTLASGLVPTITTLEAASETFGMLIEDFRNQQSPAETTDSFLLVSFVLSWLLATLTDWGAVNLRLSFEPVLPAIMLFVFGSIPPVSAGNYTVLTSCVFGVAIALWAISQRHTRIAQSSVVVRSANKRIGLITLVFGATIMAGAAVAIGGLYGDRLPYANSEPQIEFNSDFKEREVSNPFIDLEQRLVDQSDKSLFTVTSNARSYWRIVGLDTYTNRSSSGAATSVWEVRIGGSNNKESQYIQPDSVPGQLVDQNFMIEDLEVNTQGNAISQNVWIPAALTPTEITDDGGADLSTDDITQTITIGGDSSTKALSYSVLSQAPTYSATQLQTAGETLNPEPINSDLYLQLPETPIPDVVRETALEVVGGETNRYNQMLALQSYFQGFDYSLDLEPTPAGQTAVEHFLDTRIGFCQQFSGTFALMARSLGIPARVAVGFTWGDEVGADESGDTIYAVSGRNAHAWPEVWFGPELGWVPFEPTPGRGIPGATQYTGVEANQDNGVDGQQEVEIEEVEDTTSTTSVDELDSQETTQEQEPQENEIEAPAKPIQTNTYGPDKSLFEKLFPLMPNLVVPWRLLALALMLLAYPIGMPAYVKMRRSRYRKKMTTLNTSGQHTEATEAAWQLAASELRLYCDSSKAAPETSQEFAVRTHTEFDIGEIIPLSHIETKARFSSQGCSANDSMEAQAFAEEISTNLSERTDNITAWKNSLDPSRVFLMNSNQVTDKSVN